MITYNLPEDSERRSKAKDITFEEEKEACFIIKNCLKVERQEIGEFDDGEFALVQKFIDNYQNLSHHKSTTYGLWAMDSKISQFVKERIDENNFHIVEIIEKEQEFQITY